MNPGDMPRKNPYVPLGGRFCIAKGKQINIIQDKDRDIYYVGLELTIENLHEGGPYGCHTLYDLDDARDKVEELMS